jgi:hypothetical protein
MVLEALAAIGLAGNILQFIDFTAKVLNSANELKASASGFTKDAESVAQVTTSLKGLCDKLATGQYAHQNVPGGLLKLMEQCNACCQELLTILEQSRAKPGASKWRRIEQAFLSVRKKSELNDLRSRLQEFRQELILQTQVLQR